MTTREATACVNCGSQGYYTPKADGIRVCAACGGDCDTGENIPAPPPRPEVRIAEALERIAGSLERIDTHYRHHQRTRQ